MKNFQYKKVFTLEEACRLLGQPEGKAKVLAGGTDILAKVKHRVLDPEMMVDIKEIPGLNKIRYDQKEGLILGALVSIRGIEISKVIQEKFRVISEAAGMLGSLQIRHRGTLGGNICNASPAADMAPCLIAMGAKARIVGDGKVREVPLEDFFTGPGMTVLRPNEILREIWVPNVEGRVGDAYVKHTLRKAMDLAIVGVAVRLRLDDKDKCTDVKIVLGAVAPTPVRAREAENQLRGKKISDVLIEEASNHASEASRPITDVRGTAGYRKEMVKVMVRRALQQSLEKVR